MHRYIRSTNAIESFFSNVRQRTGQIDAITSGNQLSDYRLGRNAGYVRRGTRPEYSRSNREELGRRFLDHQANLKPKGVGDKSMQETRRYPGGVQGYAVLDPRAMVKADCFKPNSQKGYASPHRFNTYCRCSLYVRLDTCRAYLPQG